MGAREDIAAAASTVAGVTVLSAYHQDRRAGSGWVSLLRVERDDTGLGFMDRWAVSIATGQDLASADAFFEKHIDELLEALEPVLVVTAAFAAELQVDQGRTNGIAIEGTRAH